MMKDSLFFAREFLNAKKLRTVQGAKINSPRFIGARTNFCLGEKWSSSFFGQNSNGSSQTIFQILVKRGRGVYAHKAGGRLSVILMEG